MMNPTRRTLAKSIAAAAGIASLGWPLVGARAAQPAMKPIPSSGEMLPAVGLGTWITFNVGNDPKLLGECTDVMAAFFAAGGRMIDCSPMYASSQPTIGIGLERLRRKTDVFSAEKVWTSSASSGLEQIEQSRKFWGVPSFSLMQVHNLLSWEAHLQTLQKMKAEKRIRYIGITTSHGRRHRELERIMQAERIDFVQLTYNILDREAEQRLLPLARERGIAVIANRPYQQGHLVRRLQGKPLPDWLPETGARSWAQFLLRFIISHPDITCAIPATTRVDHVQENMAAATEPFPDAALRRRMADYVGQL